MASDGLTGTPYQDPACPTPSAADGTTIGQRGGATWPMDGDSKSGLVSSPFESPITPTPGGMETANSSELGTLPYTTTVKDGPAANSQVGVEPGVASPSVAVTPIA